MTAPRSPAGSVTPPLVTAALLGNPNTGKSTLFTALCGIPARIGNFPGVTVEEKLGRFTHDGRTIEIIDLPGTYSLAAHSPDERVAVDVLHGRLAGVPRPDCAVVVVDATNLERNLYLASQVIDCGLPVVIALSLSDVAAMKGLTIDTDLLARPTHRRGSCDPTPAGGRSRAAPGHHRHRPPGRGS